MRRLRKIIVSASLLALLGSVSWAQETTEVSAEDDPRITSPNNPRKAQAVPNLNGTGASSQPGSGQGGGGGGQGGGGGGQGGGGGGQGGSGIARFPAEFRSIDGSGNNVANPEWGSAGTELLRLTTIGYGDGAGTPSGAGLASAREISNLCVAQPEPIPNSLGASDMLWQWGQFLDHDIDLTPEADPSEPFDIAVPFGDLWFDPFATGQETIPLNRSFGSVVNGVRQQVNGITAYIDASNVYGSDPERTLELRALDGTGRLATSVGDLLPFNENGLPNAPTNDASFFLAGDFRANEQVGLTAMHTLFVREHNYWADTLSAEDSSLTGDEIYQRARAMVAAEMQAITYNEFLPALLGRRPLSRYRGYDPDVDAGIANVFAGAAYRFGHSMLSGELQRLDADREEIAAGHLSLAEAFFNPAAIIDHGIEPLLRGLSAQRAQEIDNYLVDEVRNFLFGPPGAGGFDLASLNIQRGRDHGLPSFNQVRVDYGLDPVSDFSEIHPDPLVQANLALAYATVDDIDVWVGGLAERHLPGALVGETWKAIIADQFERLRDGDRFWYRGYLSPDRVQMVERQTLATIIRRNTEIRSELSNDPFRVRRRNRGGVE